MVTHLLNELLKLGVEEREIKGGRLEEDAFVCCSRIVVTAKRSGVVDCPIKLDVPGGECSLET